MVRTFWQLKSPDLPESRENWRAHVDCRICAKFISNPDVVTMSWLVVSLANCRRIRLERYLISKGSFSVAMSSIIHHVAFYWLAYYSQPCVFVIMFIACIILDVQYDYPNRHSGS